MLYPTPCAARSFARADRVSADGFRRRACVSVRKPPIGVRGARSPATDFSSLGAREIGRSVGAGFPDSRRRPRADVVARTSSSSSSSRGASRQWKTRARRERDASATRTDANRRRSAPPRSNGAARPRRARGGLRLIWNLVVRSHRRASFVGLRARTRTTRERGTLDERRNERSTRDRA